jgi:hypothetical protein
MGVYREDRSKTKAGGDFDSDLSLRWRFKLRWKIVGVAVILLAIANLVARCG